MGTRNVLSAKGTRISSESVARKPTKIKQGATGTVHLSFVVEASLVHDIDEESKAMQTEDEYGRAVTRTDTVRSLIKDGLKYRADKRGK